MQPCFTPAWQVKDWVNLLSILTADLSFEYMDIKTSKKRPWTPFFPSLSNSFCRGIQSNAFLKSTKHEKSKFRCFCGLDFMYLSISIFKLKMLSTVSCIFLKNTLFSFQNCLLLDSPPLPSEFPVSSVVEGGGGSGVWIFSGTTQMEKSVIKKWHFFVQILRSQ